MENLLLYLNENSGALMVIFTAVVTISTVVYAVLTALLTNETRKMRRIQTEPKIEVVLKPREEAISIVNLYIRNIGLGPAYSLQFEIEKEAGNEGAEQLIKDFTEPNFFRTGIRYLGPGQEITSGYSQLTTDYEQKIDSILSVKVLYKNVAKHNYAEVFRVDLSEFKDMGRLGKPHLYSMASSLEKIQKEIHNLITGSRRIKTDVYTSGDRDKETEERQKYYEKIKGSNKNANEK